METNSIAASKANNILTDACPEFNICKMQCCIIYISIPCNITKNTIMHVWLDRKNNMTDFMYDTIVCLDAADGRLTSSSIPVAFMDVMTIIASSVIRKCCSRWAAT